MTPPSCHWNLVSALSLPRFMLRAASGVSEYRETISCDYVNTKADTTEAP